MGRVSPSGGPGGSWGLVLGLSVILFVLVVVLSFLPVVHRPEMRITDSYYHAAIHPQEVSPVLLVVIDEPSLRQYGRWPWPRKLLADLTTKLTRARAEVIGLDLGLSQPSPAGSEDDQALHDALAANGRTVLIGNYPEGSRWTGPLPLLAQAAVAVGHADCPPDFDGICRSFPATELTPEGQRWAFALELGRRVGSKHTADFLAAYGAASFGQGAGSAAAPQGEVATIPIAFRRTRFATLSAAAVLQDQNLNLARGRPVLIGFGDVDEGNQFITPISAHSAAPGILVHAQILDSIIEGRMLHEAPMALSALLLLLTCVLSIVAFRRWRGWAAAGLLLFGLVDIYIVGFLVYAFGSQKLPVGPMLLAALIGPGLARVSSLHLLERGKLHRLYEARQWMALRRWGGESGAGADEMAAEQGSMLPPGLGGPEAVRTPAFSILTPAPEVPSVMVAERSAAAPSLTVAEAGTHSASAPGGTPPPGMAVAEAPTFRMAAAAGSGSSTMNVPMVLPPTQLEADLGGRAEPSARRELLHQWQSELGSLFEIHQTVMEATRDLIAIFDDRGNLLLENKAFAAHAIGSVPQKPDGTGSSVTLPELRSQLRFREVPAQDRGNMEAEAFIGEELYWIRIAPMPVTAISPAGGKIVTLSSLRAREERDRARAEAQGFAADELRAALTTLRESARAWAQQAEAPAGTPAAEWIAGELTRLLARINGFLEVLDVDAGARPLRFEAVRMDDLVHQVFELLQPLAAARDVKLATAAASSDTGFSGDRDLLTAAVLNLMINAVTHASAGTEVKAECRNQNGELVLSVFHQAEPIAAEDLSRVFDPCYHPSGRRNWELSLGSVKRIAERHGGSVSARSGARGTRFEIYLPAKSSA
jgi:CHASE2 domain-containing sensor protein/signal transduction histidine kinase